MAARTLMAGLPNRGSYETFRHYDFHRGHGAPRGKVRTISVHVSHCGVGCLLRSSPHGRSSPASLRLFHPTLPTECPLHHPLSTPPPSHFCPFSPPHPFRTSHPPH